MAKNCFTCDLAKDQGESFACRFDYEKELKGWPMMPLCKVKVTNTATKKDKIPEEDCEAWRLKNQAAATGPNGKVRGIDFTPGKVTPIQFTVKPQDAVAYADAMKAVGFRNPPPWRPGVLLHHRGIVKQIEIELPE